MKAKLLRKLRRIGRNGIYILSTTETNGLISGMSYSYNDDFYKGLFSYGDSISAVKIKAEKRFIENNIKWIREKYSKYSRKNK